MPALCLDVVKDSWGVTSVNSVTYHAAATCHRIARVTSYDRRQGLASMRRVRLEASVAVALCRVYDDGADPGEAAWNGCRMHGERRATLLPIPSLALPFSGSPTLACLPPSNAQTRKTKRLEPRDLSNAVDPSFLRYGDEVCEAVGSRRALATGRDELPTGPPNAVASLQSVGVLAAEKRVLFQARLPLANEDTRRKASRVAGAGVKRHSYWRDGKFVEWSVAYSGKPRGQGGGPCGGHSDCRQQEHSHRPRSRAAKKDRAFDAEIGGSALASC